MIKSFVINPQNKANLISKINQLDVTSTRYVCDIREQKSKRSVEQNSRYWKLLTEFGKYLGYTPDELHEICRFKFLRNAIVIEGEKLPLLQSTTKLKTGEMADYQNAIEQWGASMGFIFDEEK